MLSLSHSIRSYFMHLRRTALLSSLLLLILLVFSSLRVFAQDVTHVIQPGENLFRIALRYGISTEALAQANGITNTAQIYAGQTLVIPGASPAAPEQNPVVEQAPVATDSLVAGTPTTHTIARGESLAGIARQYGITVDQLLQINSITNPNLIYAGQQLTVFTLPDEAAPQADPNAAAPAPQPETPAPAAASTTHVVQPGEHLSQIGRQYGVSWVAIAQANGIGNADTIYSGQTLIIPAPGTVPDLGIIEAPTAPTPIVYFGREIVVDLSDQRTYAYENGSLVRNVLVSTGLPGTPTVLGDYTIYTKLDSQTMSGPGYYLPGVPYVMYFYQGYSFHGTYWHNNFGFPMSHGCVNMPTPEAEWLYNFASVGTPVHVQW
jgi:LysM repeat protein